MARKPRGQLKEDILDATDRLLASTGDAHAVSIDSVVEAVGCTPPALYYYFPTKEQLLQETCRRQYQRFAEQLEAAIPDTDDPLDELRARGHAYLDWGLAHPEHYRLLFMTGTPRTDEQVDPSQSAGLAELIGNLQRAAEVKRLAPRDPLEMALALWSTVHGITSLAIVNSDMPPELAHAVLEVTSSALLDRFSAPRGRR